MTNEFSDFFGIVEDPGVSTDPVCAHWCGFFFFTLKIITHWKPIKMFPLSHQYLEAFLLLNILANSVVCVITGSALTDWFFLVMAHIFCYFSCLVIFYWKPDLVIFTLLYAGYFCIPINILGSCSGMKLGYLETV